MSQTAKLFTNGRSQAVRLPAAFRFNTQEVYIRKDPETGDVILSSRPMDWEEFFAVLGPDIPAEFLNAKERQQPPQNRDPFDGWQE